MAVVHGAGQREADAGPHARRMVVREAQRVRDAVRATEADAAYVAGQAVRVVRYRPDRVGAVCLVDAHRAGGADAVPVQEQHYLPHGTLVRPARGDALGAGRADAGDFP